MPAAGRPKIVRREAGKNVWLGLEGDFLLALPSQKLRFETLETEGVVGRTMFEEIEEAAAGKSGDVVIVILGGRGAQSLHRLLGEIARKGYRDELLVRLRVFTQDALAPMRMNNSLSFVCDFQRLLGEAFFEKVKSFTPIRTETDDLEGEMMRYVEELEAAGGIDIFFLGHGPEPHAASHLAYIKPGSGATASDMAGVIPVSSSILEHHISKFKAGGSAISEADETECRLSSHIMTLGPAAILSAKRVVQAIVDADTAPAKRASFRRVNETEISQDAGERARQMDENPGLWVRLHPNLRSLILPDVLQ